MKKIISLIAVISMLAVMLCGCGSDGDDGKQVTLKWAIGFYEQTDTLKVQKEINKLLAKKLPNTKIEFVLDSSMSSKWSLWMAGDTQIDIANVGYTIDLLSEIEKDSFYELDDLVKEYAPTIAKEEEKFSEYYETGKVGGKLYAIPNIQLYINDTATFCVPESLIDYIDYKALIKEAYANPTTTEKMYQIVDDYFKAAVASGKADSDYCADKLNIESLYKIFARRGYDFVGYSSSQPANIAYKVFDKNIKFVDFYETDEFKMFMKWARKWYEAGYISTDILSGDAGYGNRTPMGASHNWDMLKETDEHIYLKKSSTAGAGEYWISLQSTDEKFVSHNSVGSLQTYNAIPCTAKNPERAMKLMELLRTDDGKDILNMICYGIEGEHYEVLDDGSFKAFDYEQQGTSSSKYGIPNWEVGTHMNMNMIYPYDQEQYDLGMNYYEKIYPEIKRTKLAGYTFDIDPVFTEFTNVTTVLTEYQMQLISGAVANYQTKYEEAITKLNAAGMDKILKELQSQADDYVKNNK